MLAPLADMVLGVPAQDVVLDAATVGIGLTVRAAVLLLVQPMEVPFIVYVVEDAGVAVTLEPVVKFIPVTGDQVKAFAPLAVKVVEKPAHMVALEVAIVGIGFTVTIAVLLLLHPVDVPVIV